METGVMEAGSSPARFQEMAGLVDNFTPPGVNGGRINQAALLEERKGRLWSSGLAFRVTSLENPSARWYRRRLPRATYALSRHGIGVAVP
jgi:hypothetical protein